MSSQDENHTVQTIREASLSLIALIQSIEPIQDGTERKDWEFETLKSQAESAVRNAAIWAMKAASTKIQGDLNES
jgi:predicted GTPase